MRVVVSQFEGIDATPVLPLAAGCLVASARVDPELAPAVQFSIELERRAIARVVAGYERPDVLGFSLYPWNAAYSLAVAAAARAAYPEALIVAGGPSVPRRPERARRFLADHPALDVLVFAEGEPAFRALLRAHLHGASLEDIPGIAIGATRGREQPRFTEPPGRVFDFAAAASPFLDGTFDSLLERHRGRFSMAILETNRGCPFSCTFCDWSLTKHVVELPLERVHAELEWIAAHGFRHIMMADANFGIRPRDTGIARYLAALRARTGAPTSFYFYLTKNDHARNLETIEILQQADIGCWVGLAVQDFDDAVLEAVKRDNIQTGESLALRRICGERGIPTFNELILGLPGQTYESFTATVALAMPPLPRHDFVLFLCRLIDNTELGDPASRERFGIQTRHCEWKTSTPDWDPVVDEYQEVVVATRDLPIADWQRAYRFSFLAAALYNLRLLRVVLAYVGDRCDDLRAYLEFLADHLEDAAPGSVYETLGAIVDRYTASVLAGGSFVLPSIGSPSATPVYVDEALATEALRRYDRFLAETAGHTQAFLADRIAPALGEAFRYQAFITPRWSEVERRAIELAHDWPGYVAAGGGAPLANRHTTVRYQPPPYAGLGDFAAFASTHLGCIRARLDIGVVEPQAPVTRAPERQLIVLPG
ncbi:MAG TPA: radical SAM protein [Kofleriaceae bacterium]|nr:radical SAM protein [Kofleriaceae bacterium]